MLKMRNIFLYIAVNIQHKKKQFTQVCYFLSIYLALKMTSILRKVLICGTGSRPDTVQNLHLVYSLGHGSIMSGHDNTLEPYQ